MRNTTTTAHASLTDTLRVAGTVLLPLVARGLLLRRAAVVAAAERLHLEQRAVALLVELRERYGSGPLVLRIPRRRIAVVLDADQAAEILERSPHPFTPANLEKRAALRHFQPHGVLISEGAEREDRRRFNERALDTSAPVHSHAGEMLDAVTGEAERLRDDAATRGELDWDLFITSWFRMVRRLVLGEEAAHDEHLTDLLAELRSDANWAYARPRRQRLRSAFDARLSHHLRRAEPGSLAAVMGETPTTSATVPHQQVPQWLFAFDAAGMAAIRTLALIAAHPDTEDEVLDELRDRDLRVPQELPLLRGCVLDGLRLWPTTPAILRDTTTVTDVAGATLPADTAVLIYAPLLHRDPSLPYADRFEPRLWFGEGAARQPLVPFSAGPASCPGRNVVLLTVSTFLAVLLDGASYRLEPPDLLRADVPLPGVLSPYALRFGVGPAA